MNKVLHEPNRSIFLSSEKQNEIRKIFHQHWETLKTQMDVDIAKISNWCSETVQHIEAHAKWQIRFIKRHYEAQQAILEEKRKENLHTAKACHSAKESEVFNQIRDICQSLQFKLATLELIKREVVHVCVTTDVPVIADDQIKTNVNAHESENRQKDFVNTHDTNTESSFINSSPSVSNKNHQHRSDTTHSTGSDWPSGNNNNVGGSTTNNNDSDNKCPICYMIFPSHMTTLARNNHVVEHDVTGEDFTFVAL